MNSVATRRFWELFQALPADVQDLAVKNYRLWRSDPGHPSLRFKRLQGQNDRFSIRVGDRYRALGALRGETITWVWIGTQLNTTGLSTVDHKASRRVEPNPQAADHEVIGASRKNYLDAKKTG